MRLPNYSSKIFLNWLYRRRGWYKRSIFRFFKVLLFQKVHKCLLEEHLVSNSKQKKHSFPMEHVFENKIKNACLITKANAFSVNFLMDRTIENWHLIVIKFSDCAPGIISERLPYCPLQTRFGRERLSFYHKPGCDLRRKSSRKLCKVGLD